MVVVDHGAARGCFPSFFSRRPPLPTLFSESVARAPLSPFTFDFKLIFKLSNIWFVWFAAR
jgi:hypothetical protein